MSKHEFKVKIRNKVTGENVLISKANSAGLNGGPITQIRPDDVDIFPSVDASEPFQVLYVRMETLSGERVVLSGYDSNQCIVTPVGTNEREWKLDFSPVYNPQQAPMLLKGVEDENSTCSTITVNIGTGEPPVSRYANTAATWTCGAFTASLIAPFIKDFSVVLWAVLTGVTGLASIVLHYIARKDSK